MKLDTCDDLYIHLKATLTPEAVRWCPNCGAASLEADYFPHWENCDGTDIDLIDHMLTLERSLKALIRGGANA